ADQRSGTDRRQAVASRLGLGEQGHVVNVQADEPMAPPALIDQVAADLRAFPEASIATLAEPLDDVQTLFNPTAVKVVTDHQGFALYFSRAPMPWNTDPFADVLR